MPDQPFHHGRLRAELLERAERVVREDGPEALSLRELARQAGVTHAAPRRHFADRKSLLDAVAEHGFDRLTAAMLDAAESVDTTAPAARFRAAATVYVHFAAQDPHLHELMFATKNDTAPPTLTAAAERFFSVSRRLLAPSPDAESAGGTADPRYLLIVAALQGTGALVASGRLSPSAIGGVLDEAARMFFPSARGETPGRSGADAESVTPRPPGSTKD